MSSVNLVVLVGRLGADPELRYTPSNRPVCNLSVATSEVWKDKQSGEKKEKTEWHRVTCWGDLAETCQKFLAKGRQVYIQGKLQTTSYEKDGQKRYTTNIVAEKVVFLGSADGQSQGGGGGGKHRKEHASGGRGGWGGGEDPPSDEGSDQIPF